MEFKLTEAIQVSVNGEFEKHETLILKAPPAKEKKYPIKLRKGFMAASLDMTKFADPKAKDAEKSDVDIKPNDIEQMLYASNINVEKYMEDFQSLMMITGVCTIGGQRLTKVHWENIPQSDIDRLIGAYLVNFYIPLWNPKEITDEQLKTHIV